MPGELSLDRLRTDVADLLDCEPSELDPDADLFDQGLDSLRLMRLVELWRERGAHDIRLADLAELPTLRTWSTVLTH